MRERHSSQTATMEEAVHEGMERHRQHHRMTLWAHFGAIALGAWLIASPFTLGYESTALMWNDIASGILAIVFASFSLSHRMGWAQWANTFLGIWLLFAPLVFWAPTAAAYTNETLAGALLIAFALLAPGMPGMLMMPGPDTPSGWSYNPSTWLQRAPIIILALASFLISRYLAAFQLGHIDSAWDPFFEGSTMTVLNSRVSEMWPISDAGFGAMAYMLEALSGFMAGPSRWRTMPWMVLMFFVLVVPLGIVSIGLVISQPVLVGAWCTLCLVTALFMLIMIPFAIDEVVAMGQFMAQSRREGSPFWRTFWKGGTLESGGADDTRTPSLGARPLDMAGATAWGISIPWNLVASAAIGLWLMAAPAALGSQGIAADSDHLTGALIATFAVIAMAEPVRSIRFMNILFGIWLIAAPWILGGSTLGATWNDVAAGAALILLSLPRGPVKERYGSWNRFIV